MAMRVLTNQEKEELKNFDDFKEECKWSILNKASYWTGLDGTTVPGNDRILWAKSRTYGANIVRTPSQVDPNLNTIVVDRFLMYVKNILCVDDQVAFDAATVTAFLVTNINFENMADSWFNDQIATTVF